MAKKISASQLRAEIARLPTPSTTFERQSGSPEGTTETSKTGSQRTFLDSNILLYAEDSKNRKKQELALALILQHRRQRTGVVSVQVLQEFFVNATRKLGISIDDARYKVQFHSRFQVVEPTASDVVFAIDLLRFHRLSFWDSLILHSAKQAGCRVLLTEDMQHGQTIDGVRIVNPFTESSKATLR